MLTASYRGAGDRASIGKLRTATDEQTCLAAPEPTHFQKNATSMYTARKERRLVRLRLRGPGLRAPPFAIKSPKT